MPDNIFFKLRTFIGSLLKLITFLRYYIFRAYSIIVDLFYRAYSIVDIVTYLRAFSNTFLNTLTALSLVNFGEPRNVGPRI